MDNFDTSSVAQLVPGDAAKKKLKFIIVAVCLVALGTALALGLGLGLRKGGDDSDHIVTLADPPVPHNLTLRGVVTDYAYAGITHNASLNNKLSELEFVQYEDEFCSYMLEQLEDLDPDWTYNCSLIALEFDAKLKTRVMFEVASETTHDLEWLMYKVRDALLKEPKFGLATLVDTQSGIEGICSKMCDASDHAQCVTSKTIPFCKCDSGFDGPNEMNKCSDVNECSMDNGGCGVDCQNTIGSFFCKACDEFACDNDMCVSHSKKCDGKNDCGDYSDEKNCPCDRYSSHQTQCDIGPCIRDDKWCDGIRDCLDGSDEVRGCEDRCPSSTFKCYTDFESFKCKNRSATVCNNKAECIGATDEMQCSGYSKCHWGMGIKSDEKCDGTNDCFDWSDEIGCNYQGCPAHTVRCNASSILGNPRDFYCISADYLCDTVRDCPRGEDETPEACAVKKNTPTDCSKVEITVTKEGFLTSPNYPQNYGNNEECHWILEAEEGHAIRLTIDDFTVQDAQSKGWSDDYWSDYEYGSQCVDGVAIYDVGVSTSNPLWSGCGTQYSRTTVESSGSMLEVVFVSNEYTTARGFKMTYSPIKAECNLAFHARNADSIHSPDYPSHYGNSRVCLWNIEADIGYRIELTFTDFHLEAPVYGECADFVQVIDDVFRGLSRADLDTNSLFKKCGSQGRKVVRSTGYYLTVLFISDKSVSAKGFKASYKQVWHGCDPVLEFVCADDARRCIDRSKKCDGIADCSDKSDEWDCDCDKDDSFKCNSERICMPNDWLCDGFEDCEGGQDEEGCAICTESQFQCENNKDCIEQSQRCDGHLNCDDGSDEESCLRLLRDDGAANNAGILIVGNEADHVTAVCSTNWNDDYSTLACKALGFKGSESFDLTPINMQDDVNQFLEVDETVNKASILLGSHYTNETCGSIVELTCLPNTCGQPVKNPEGRDVRAKVINGDLADRESWPWMVSIHHSINEDKHICGGSIISKYWILTAGHCISGDPSDFTVYIGDEDNSKGQTFEVTDVIAHENYTSRGRWGQVTFYSLFVNDVALLKLKTPILLDYRKTMPVCLPGPHQADSSFKRCYVTGWGQTLPKKGSGTTPDRMRQGRLNLMPTEECQAYFTDHWAEFNFKLPYEPPVYEDMHICAQQIKGKVDSCYGDSGGPLNCEDHSGNWYVVGIVSHGPEMNCLSFTVYERVSRHLAWIHDTTLNHGNGV